MSSTTSRVNIQVAIANYYICSSARPLPLRAFRRQLSWAWEFRCQASRTSCPHHDHRPALFASDDIDIKVRTLAATAILARFLTYWSAFQRQPKQRLFFHTTTANMSHESVWYSRPRTYGKGAREWCVYPKDMEESSRKLEENSVVQGKGMESGRT